MWPWQAKENKDIPIQDWHCILSQSHCAPVLLHTCSQLCNCTTPINTKGVVWLEQMRIRMINNMQIWHHNNPKHYGEKKKKKHQSPYFVGFFSSPFWTNIFSLKPLAINKASLPLITEAQVLRALHVQQKCTLNITCCVGKYACKYGNWMQDTDRICMENPHTVC